jgi:hypothetical protein
MNALASTAVEASRYFGVKTWYTNSPLRNNSIENDNTDGIEKLPSRFY